MGRKREVTTEKRRKLWIIPLVLVAAIIIAGVAVMTMRYMQKQARDAQAESLYAQAEELLEQGRTEEAAEAFAALEGYADSGEQAGKLFYEQAEGLLAEGKITYAAMAFGKAGDYKDARERSFALWDQFVDRDTVACLDLYYDVAAIRPDGTIIHTPDDGESLHPLFVRMNPEWDVDRTACDQWTDIIAIDGSTALIGLKADGTVVVSNNHWDLSDWTDIVDVCIGDDYVLGLKSDGTIVAEGEGEHGQTAAKEWTDIIAITKEWYSVLGLRADGTVVTAGCELPSNWQASDMQYIEYGQCEVSGWEDIVRVFSVDCGYIGIKADGSYVTSGNGEPYHYVPGNASGFVEVARGISEPAVIQEDGTLGCDWLPNGTNREDWHDLVALSSGLNYFVGTRSDGTVLLATMYEETADAVDGWIVKIPTAPDFELIASGFED